jgi:hypothetical protein
MPNGANAERREMPNGAKCRTARNAERRAKSKGGATDCDEGRGRRLSPSAVPVFGIQRRLEFSALRDSAPFWSGAWTAQIPKIATAW